MPVALYRELVQKQPVAYGALHPCRRPLSFCPAPPNSSSPIAAATCRARPMKGTLKRGRTLAEDEAGRAALAADEKNRAENLMIVDLLRNDLGRIAQIGRVKVTDLFTVETYRTLHTMTSGIAARLKPGISTTPDPGQSLPLRLDHRRPQAARHADHRGAGSAARAAFIPARSAISPPMAISPSTSPSAPPSSTPMAMAKSALAAASSPTAWPRRI